MTGALGELSPYVLGFFLFLVQTPIFKKFQVYMRNWSTSANGLHVDQSWRVFLDVNWLKKSFLSKAWMIGLLGELPLYALVLPKYEI